MTSSVKTFVLSSSFKEEALMTTMPGIVSILRPNSDTDHVSSNSLRRTLSADMSSTKWLSQHGFSPLKKIASSENILLSVSQHSSDDDDDDDGEQVETENMTQFDIWSSIIQQKKQDDSNNVPPYLHPLVRRSSSCLSDKSLHLCTESLGSETGSDGFSDGSDYGDAEEEKEEQLQEQRVVNVNFLAAAKTKKTPKSFPPPITSLSGHRDGTSMLMKSRRDNGRLVLEAVSVSSPTNLQAERQDGRLILSFINGLEEEEMAKKEHEVNQFEVELEGSDEEKEYEDEEDETEHDDEEEEEEEEEELERMDQPLKLSGTMADKTLILAKLDEGTAEMLEEAVKPITQSLPPRPPLAARMMSSPPKTVAAATTAKPGAVSLNQNEYFWMEKPISEIKNSKNMIYIVQNCKEQRRNLLCYNSYCIATS